MRKLISLLLCLGLMLGIIPALGENAQPFTEQPTPLWNDSEQIGSLNLRFYADKPHIAYIGIKAYMAASQELDLAVTPREDGTWAIAHPNGTTLVADPALGTLYADDWAGFMTPKLPYIRSKTGIKDTDCTWTEVTELIYEDEPTPVTFDFAKYGIAMYADGDDVYLPLALLGCMLEDESLNLIAYNGDKLFQYSGSMENIYTFAPGYYEGEKMQALINGEAQREPDQIREAYGELCFMVDYFYGHPGPAFLDTAIAEKGLDAALDDLPDGRGDKIRQALHSPDYIEYLAGMYELFCRGLGDGHTVAMTPNALVGIVGINGNVSMRLSGLMMVSMSADMSLSLYACLTALTPVRREIWGDETYREYGSTAIIRIDAFEPDEAGWHAWEDGTGEMPMDALGITCRGLEKAAANPDIKNIIFDLTANSGGSQDLMNAIVGLVTGDVDFHGYNTLTKQRMCAVFRTDRNMDGIIDELDREVAWDYNFGVLTTRMAFSCGNMFPFMMQDKGAVVIGEPTGGGSSVVQMMTLSDGPVFLMSSYQWNLRNGKGEAVEAGATPDLPIERIETTDNENPFFPRLVPGDYSPYFDDAMLNQMMNEWFAQEEAPAA